jgi:hypothetical protein
METSKLEGRDLDYAVALACGWKFAERPSHWKCSGTFAFFKEADAMCPVCTLPHYTEGYEAEKVMRIIEGERIHLMPHRGPPEGEALENWWYAEALGHWFTDVEESSVPITADGPTLAVAALRCFVKSKLGATVSLHFQRK